MPVVSSTNFIHCTVSVADLINLTFDAYNIALLLLCKKDQSLFGGSMLEFRSSIVMRSEEVWMLVDLVDDIDCEIGASQSVKLLVVNCIFNRSAHSLISFALTFEASIL